jgi:ArsR family transcriptional regulator, lead/cadmium/zinc/bismuth-responsive transcriptional repressor
MAGRGRGALTERRRWRSSQYMSGYSDIVLEVSDAHVTTHRHPSETTQAEHLSLMADLFGVLSDPSRLRILMCLQRRDEVCVNDLSADTRISDSAVSHALRLLRAHGIVRARRDGRQIFYALVDEHVRMLLDATAEHFARAHGPGVA